MKVMDNATASAATAGNTGNGNLQVTAVNPESIKMAITMVATVPILLVYPFVQKYFVTGMTLGAVKSWYNFRLNSLRLLDIIYYHD